MSGTRWRWPVLIFAMTFPVFMAWFYFVMLAPPSDSKPPGWAPLTAYAAGKAIQFGLPLAWVFGFERSKLDSSAWFKKGSGTVAGTARRLLRTTVPDPFLNPGSLGLGWGVGFGILVALAMFGLYFFALRGTELFAQTPAKIAAKLALFHAATPARFLMLAVFLSVIHSFLEEYYWRWFVFGELRKLVSLPPAVLLSSLAFMGHHVIILAVYFPGRFFSLAVPFSLGIAIGGAVWAGIYERGRSLLAPWISHLLVDAAIFVIGYNMIFG